MESCLVLLKVTKVDKSIREELRKLCLWVMQSYFCVVSLLSATQSASTVSLVEALLELELLRFRENMVRKLQCQKYVCFPPLKKNLKLFRGAPILPDRRLLFIVLYVLGVFHRLAFYLNLYI